MKNVKNSQNYLEWVEEIKDCCKGRNEDQKFNLVLIVNLKLKDIIFPFFEEIEAIGEKEKLFL